MFDDIFCNDSIHTQPAKEIEFRVRAREEERFIQREDLGRQGAGREKRSDNPVKSLLAVIFSSPRVFLKAVVGSINH